MRIICKVITRSQEAWMITLKRVYDEPQPQDGYRVLVDRLWPRGIQKARLPL
ncbi:DUF488 domain-containing protein, partial [Cronobacter condimenti]|uniref:DUF488 domain-containing protein n=1 Tax=Cronobacter condimenti TaxID=1163710 RepID=UPI003B8A5CF7